MINDLPRPLVDGIDPWQKIDLDAATCLRAEQSAAAAGLSVEEWLACAIRRACPPVTPRAAANDDIADDPLPRSLFEPLHPDDPFDVTPLRPASVGDAASDAMADGAADTGSKWLRRFAMVAGILLAVAAGVVSAQYFIPDPSSAAHVALAPAAPISTAPPAAPAPTRTALYTPEPEKAASHNAAAAPMLPRSAAAAAGTPKPAPTGKVASVATGAKTPQKVAPIDKAEPPSNPRLLPPWLEQRVKSGDPIAQYRLGVLYALGEGVTQNYRRAAQLFKTSAEHGVAEAQYNIAVMYSEGLGIARNPKEATLWYRRAAAQGNPSAAFNLGVAYANGIGVTQSMNEAAQWFRKAAEAGIINAQFNLGLLYERGEGVPLSQVDAYAWYSAAAARGDAGATQRRARLAGTMPPSLLKEAQARATQVLASVHERESPSGESTAALKP